MQYNRITNADLRRRARQTIRLGLPTLAMVIFLAELPGLISSTFNTLTLDTGSVINSIMRLLVKTDSGELTVTQFTDQSLEMLLAFLQSTPFITSTIVRLMSMIVTPVLSMGLIASLLKLVRGESITAGDVFCRRRLFFRSIGLILMIGLKYILWCLPGIALNVLGIVLYRVTKIEFLLDALSFGGLGLMVWLGVRALLSYALADIVMADRPETRIMAAIRRSTEIMHTRRASLMSMYMLFIALSIAKSYLETMLIGMLPVIGLVIGMALDLLLSLYMYTSLVYYYLRETEGKLPEIRREEAKAMNE